MKRKYSLIVCFIAVIVGFSGMVYADIENGLILHWSFNDCTMTDLSGNGYNGNISGSTDCIDGVNRSAMTFTAESETYATLEKTIDTNQIKSFSFWINSIGFHEKDDSSIILSKYNWYGRRSFFLTSANNREQVSRIGIVLYNDGDGSQNDALHSYYPEIPDETVEVLVNEPLEFGVWNHIVINIFDTKIEMWVNNQIVTRTNRLYSSYYDSEEPTYVGNVFQKGGDFNYDYFLNGTLDEFRIYNRNLTDSEIQELYNKVSKPSDDSLVCGTNAVCGRVAYGSTNVEGAHIHAFESLDTSSGEVDANHLGTGYSAADGTFKIAVKNGEGKASDVGALMIQASHLGFADHYIVSEKDFNSYSESVKDDWGQRLADYRVYQQPESGWYDTSVNLQEGSSFCAAYAETTTDGVIKLIIPYLKIDENMYSLVVKASGIKDGNLLWDVIELNSVDSGPMYCSYQKRVDLDPEKLKIALPELVILSNDDRDRDSVIKGRIYWDKNSEKLYTPLDALSKHQHHDLSQVIRRSTNVRSLIEDRDSPETFKTAPDDPVSDTMYSQNERRAIQRSVDCNIFKPANDFATTLIQGVSITPKGALFANAMGIAAESYCLPEKADVTADSFTAATAIAGMNIIIGLAGGTAALAPLSPYIGLLPGLINASEELKDHYFETYGSLTMQDKTIDIKFVEKKSFLGLDLLRLDEVYDPPENSVKKVWMANANDNFRNQNAVDLNYSYSRDCDDYFWKGTTDFGGVGKNQWIITVDWQDENGTMVKRTAVPLISGDFSGGIKSFKLSRHSPSITLYFEKDGENIDSTIRPTKAR